MTIEREGRLSTKAIEDDKGFFQEKKTEREKGKLPSLRV